MGLVRWWIKSLLQAGRIVQTCNSAQACVFGWGLTVYTLVLIWLSQRKAMGERSSTALSPWCGVVGVWSFFFFLNQPMCVPSCPPFDTWKPPTPLFFFFFPFHSMFRDLPNMACFSDWRCSNHWWTRQHIFKLKENVKLFNLWNKVEIGTDVDLNHSAAETQVCFSTISSNRYLLNSIMKTTDALFLGRTMWYTSVQWITCYLKC